MRRDDDLTTILCRCHEIWETLEPSGPHQTCNGTALHFRTYCNNGFCQDRGSQSSLKSCRSLRASRYSQLLTGPEGSSPLSRQADSGSCKQPVTHSPYCVIKNQMYQIASLKYRARLNSVLRMLVCYRRFGTNSSPDLQSSKSPS